MSTATVLNRFQAQYLVLQGLGSANPRARQAVIDFCNDMGAELLPGPAISIVAEEPPEGMKFKATAPVFMHLVELDQHQDLQLCRNTIKPEDIESYIKLDAGFGKLSIRAQLWKLHKRSPQLVTVER